MRTESRSEEAKDFDPEYYVRFNMVNSKHRYRKSLLIKKNI